MSGETDLEKMLASLSAKVRPGTYTMVSLGAADVPILGNGVEMVMSEDEGFTVVATLEVAEAKGWPVSFVASWLTLEVHSSLEAVGLTAAFAKALTAERISCNVLAGYYHDHLLVPVDRTDDALACLVSLRSQSAS